MRRKQLVCGQDHHRNARLLAQLDDVLPIDVPEGDGVVGAGVDAVNGIAHT